MNSEEYKVILEERATKKTSKPQRREQGAKEKATKKLTQKYFMIVLKPYDADFIVIFSFRYCILLINLIYLHEKRYLITFVWVN